jgi:hypothetical protein
LIKSLMHICGRDLISFPTSSPISQKPNQIPAIKFKKNTIGMLTPPIFS